MEPRNTQEAEANPLTPELVKDLLALSLDNKVEVRHGALNLILQFTNTEEARLRFKDTEIDKVISKNVATPALSTICLSNLINFTSSPVFENKFTRLIEPILLEARGWTGLQLELALLFLTNMSKEKDAAEILIGKDAKEGYFIELLLGVLQNDKQDKAWHVANVLANITNLEEGRKYFAKHPKTLLRLAPMLISTKRDKRLALIKVLRNCLFEWENEEFTKVLLDENSQFIDSLGIYLCNQLASFKVLLQDSKPYLKILNDYGYSSPKFDASHETSKQFQLEELELTVDTMMILSNTDFVKLQPKYKKTELRAIIGELLNEELPEEVKNKVEVLHVFFV